VVQILVKEDKLSKKMESVVIALITLNQSRALMILKLRSSEQFVLLNVKPMKGYCKMEIANNVPKVQDFRKTSSVVVMYLVNIIKLKEMTDNVQIAHLTQDHIQMKRTQKFVRQKSALRGNR
jgi:hypothetical protein